MPSRDHVAGLSCNSSSRGIQEEEHRAQHSWDQVHREKDVTGMASPPKDEWQKINKYASVNSSQPGACTHYNKKMTAKRGVMSKRASSNKLIPVMLTVGWIVGCTAVVYFVFIFAWKRGARGRN